MTTDHQDAMFDLPPTPPPEQPAKTPGQKRIERQAAAIAAGLHPLSLVVNPIRLRHPADKTATPDDAKNRPERCGTCHWWMKVGGHARDFRKCLYGARTHPNGNLSVASAPRYSAGGATDVRSWWPACVNYQPEDS